uniref:RRM domain-containing protein n=1 Tax=Strigamia maritima TaxID=126957 RepID=T1JB90_STRMM
MATSTVDSWSACNDLSTLFVRNLPRHVTTQKLEEVFSAVGSLRKCFVVTEKGDKTVSKGYAYVTFLSKTDAQNAIDNVKSIDGAPINLKFATSKKVDGETNNIREKYPKRGKNARLIIRNLSFKATEVDIKKMFSKYGKITEVSIPKKKDGKMYGFCFVQFFEMSSANTALAEMNSKKILGRPVAVDWALPKDKFLTLTNKLAKPKEDENTELKRKTLFIRNLTFDTTKEDLAAAFKEFGKIHYAVICMDPDTEHSKGTAFVKFDAQKNAEACLQKANDESEDGGIVLDGKKVTVCLAMSREEIIQKRDDAHKKEAKDSRNLYLAREGLIRPGTAAAEGVSAADMNKRGKLETWKGQMLKNLNIFIANNRLCVRNLPLTMTDDSLRAIYEKAAGADAQIREARVIRNRAQIGTKSLGESKGYGFVTFATHEQALKALRHTNNNPNIFSKNQRPIVEFSLEKKGAINAKLKRLEQSRKKLNTPRDPAAPKNVKHSKKIKNTAVNQNVIKEEIYMGAKGRPGSKRILPARRGKVKLGKVKNMGKAKNTRKEKNTVKKSKKLK